MAEEIRDPQLIRQLERARKNRNRDEWLIWQYWQWITRVEAPIWAFFPDEIYKPEKAEELVDLLGRWSTENVAEKYGSIFDKFGGHHEYIERMVAEDTRLWRQLWRRYVQAHSSLVFDGIRRIFQ